MLGKIIVKVNIDISCKYYSVLAYLVQLLYETLDTLIEALQLSQSDSLSFADRQTEKSKDQVPKQHNYFSRICPDICELTEQKLAKPCESKL